MKTAMLAFLVMVSVSVAQWVPVAVNTNTGQYKPAMVNTDLVDNTEYWAGYAAASNINANYRNLLNVRTGWFDVIYLAGVRLGTTGGTSTVVEDAPISGVESDGQTPGTITYRDVPTRYSGASFWYPFDYDSTVILDASGEGIHAVNRPASAPMTWSDYALAATKIGENYLVQINSNGVLQAAPSATWGAWVKFTTEATNNNVLISAGGVSNRVAIWMDATNLYSVVCGAGVTSTLTYAYGAGLATGTWHRVVSSYEKKGGSGTATAEHRLWLDGEMVAEDAAAQNFFVANSTRFMAINTDGTPTANKFVDGDIDDVFAAREVWSPLTVTNDWTAGRSMAIYEYAKSTPYPVSPVSPLNGANTATGPVQSLSWSLSSVAEEYRLYSWTNNVAPTTVVSLVSNSYNIGTTYNNRTNYWTVVASNAYGQATSSVFVFYPYTFATNYFTNMAFYADAKTLGTYLSDKNPRLGVDNFSYVGGISWADYALVLNGGDSAHNDYLVTTSSVVYTTGSPKYQFTIGFWFRWTTIPDATMCLLSESGAGYDVNDGLRTSLQYAPGVGYQWTVRATNVFGGYYGLGGCTTTQLYSASADLLWHHIAVAFSWEGTYVRMPIWFDGVLVKDTPLAISSSLFSAPQFSSPIYIGMNPFQANGLGKYGLNPEIELDDVFIVEYISPSPSGDNWLKSIFSQNRSLNVTY